MRPVIGITCDYDWENNRVQLFSGYYEGILRCGGLPFLIPCIEGNESLSFLARINGLLISGGGDVDACYFREPPHTNIGSVNPLRDKLEITLCKGAAASAIPTLGICRGAQVVNIAMGGDIYQDLNSQWEEGTLINHNQKSPKWYGSHQVILEENSKLKSILGVEMIGTNSFHHQANRHLGSSLYATARTQDGVIEAVESHELDFFIGVQWHPEHMWQRCKPMMRLFSAFVDYAKKNSALKKSSID